MEACSKNWKASSILVVPLIQKNRVFQTGTLNASIVSSTHGTYLALGLERAAV